MTPSLRYWHPCRRYTYLAVTILLLTGTWVGCKAKKLLQTSTTAYIIGPSDIQSLSDSTRESVPQEAMKADVLLATRLVSRKTKFCSGSLIEPQTPGGPMRVLTNHHCFAASDENGKALKNILSEACVATKVYFGFEASKPEAAFETACVPGSLRTDYNGDLAVFSLTSEPPSKYQPLKFFSGANHGIGRSAIIVHHPDVEEYSRVPPGGSVRLPTAAVTKTDCKVLGLFDSSEWELDRTLPFSLRHTCDLIHGSSGSALVDRETGTLIGVNWGGIKISQGSDTRVENVATRGDYALAFVNDNLDGFTKGNPSLRPQMDGLADTGSSASDEGEKKTKKDIVSGITGHACGTLNANLPAGGHAVPWVLFLVLLVPFGMMIGARKG
jgi:hypothetical protein